MGRRAPNSASPAAERASAAERPVATAREWADWRWQLRHAVTTVGELAERLALAPADAQAIERAAQTNLGLRVTPYYLGLCEPRDPDGACPIRRQVIPHPEEGHPAPGEGADPLAEGRHQVAPFLVRRYPDRALLLATDHCAVHCRFCTRSRLVGRGSGAAGAEGLRAALSWLAAHPEVRDVIVSGGDPLTFGTDRLVDLVARLRAIPHIDVIRLATRAPVCLPMRVTDRLVAALRPYHPVWVVTHFNHPLELTEAAEQACRRFIDAGFPVVNQTVLLRGVNDRASVLTKLLRGLVRWRVAPYYLHQMDPVVGCAHLRTPVATGVELLEQLQGRVSGLALPKLVVDTPGGGGKVPLGPDYVVRRAAGCTTFRTPLGGEADYVDPPEPSAMAHHGEAPRRAGKG